jgi:hypothetical protein
MCILPNEIFVITVQYEEEKGGREEKGNEYTLSYLKHVNIRTIQECKFTKTALVTISNPRECTPLYSPYAVKPDVGTTSGMTTDAHSFSLHGVTARVVVNVKLYPCVIKHHAMKTFEGVKLQLHVFLTSALDGGK